MKSSRFFTIRLTMALCTILLAVFMSAANAQEAAAKNDLPEGKQTSLGLYLTAAEAYDRWIASPDAVRILDVRTLEEYLYVGHAPMAWNIPLLFQSHEWNAEKENFAFRPNPDFLSMVSEVARPADTIMVMCRSGGRSAMAVNMLAEAGYTNVYQIVDGMEGDAVKDPLSVFQGQRLRNGWKNSGLPWTYAPDIEKIKLNTDTRESKDDT
jgi:rhodanese-related sulfurtransferase